MKKIKIYNDIQPNHNLCFEVIYYNISKILQKMETPMIKACCNNRTIESLENLRLRVEQMVSKYKGDNLTAEKRKRKEIRKEVAKELRRLKLEQSENERDE